MHMRLIFFFLFLIQCFHLWAQNLVPNPSFEDHSDCPTVYPGSWQLNMIELATPWINAKKRPYYFHPCAYSGELRPPDFGPRSNFFGYKHPRTGLAMMGLHVSDDRDYAGIELMQELIEGKTYYVEFYVSPHIRRDSTSINMGQRFCFTDAVGAYFSENSIKVTGDIGDNIYRKSILPFVPQVEHRGEVINNPEDYTRICGTFVAQGGERFLTIGNFRPDQQTNILPDWGNVLPHLNIMFIDDVSVEEFDLVPDSIILCVGESINLKAGFRDEILYWNNGIIGDSITIIEEGEYIVFANLGRCIVSDTVRVFKMDDNNISSEYSYSICDGEEIVLKSSIQGQYLWEDNTVLNERKVSSEGVYNLQINNICGEFNERHKVSLQNCKCNFFVPDAFSPNGDGINDFFKIYYFCEEAIIESLYIRLYDRWGGLVFSADNIDSKWDGKKRGEPVLPGEYLYVVDITYLRPDNSKISNEKLRGSVLVYE